MVSLFLNLMISPSTLSVEPSVISGTQAQAGGRPVGVDRGIARAGRGGEMECLEGVGLADNGEVAAGGCSPLSVVTPAMVEEGRAGVG